MHQMINYTSSSSLEKVCKGYHESKLLKDG